MIRSVRRLAGRALDRRFARLQTEVQALARSVDELAEGVHALAEAGRLAGEATEHSIEGLRRSIDGEIHGMLRSLAAEHPRNRRALFALRETPEYERPFTEVRPLVTITVTTRAGRTRLLRERALPSALAQTYSPLEVLVVSDAAGPETRAAVAGLEDDRVRFLELTHQVVHPDPWTQWLVGQGLARNYAHSQARGLWIADLDDDDALRPDAVEGLLALAREHRAEVAYGVMEQHHPDGATSLIGTFPPAPRQADWKDRGLPYQPWDGSAGSGTLFHGGLRTIFAREHVAAELGVPGDYFLLERMVRAGVSFAMLERVVYDYYPATLWEQQRRAPES